MHLMELLELRSTPAAGVSIGLTRRCPLHCAHCSTNSTMESEEHPAGIFEKFVASFAPDNRPEILSMSGGEALLRPRLVRSLAESARRVGTRSSVLSGLFFARQDTIPPLILAAIDALDHFSVSLDVYHEQEVPRDNVFRVLEIVLDRGTEVSMHLVAGGSDDPYIDGLVEDIRRRFGSGVPMLVNSLGWFGRARDWLEVDTSADANGKIGASPCSMAAWPVVGFDGCVVACGNDDVLDDLPAHLVLGHIAEDTWAEIRQRTLTSGAIRAVRLYGPEYIADRNCPTLLSEKGYCETCKALSANKEIAKQLDLIMSRPSSFILESQVDAMQKEAGALSFLRRHGVPRYADLATLGYAS